MRPLSSTCFNAYGRRVFLNPEAHHEREEDFPPRYLVDFRAQTLEQTGFGFRIFDKCDSCGQLHRCWLTADRFWRLVPKELRKKKLCVSCYRWVTRTLRFSRRVA